MAETAATNPPKVSVIALTYNHEKYVRETLDSFVAQKTDFPVEILVADDASTDSTPAIIREYADRHPHLFRPTLRSENLGAYANVVDILSAARGEYIAMCEGDDYWTDPRKLSKQVALLDRQPNTTVCFHPVQVIWEDGWANDSTFPPAQWRLDLSLDGLLRRNFIQTNSVMYRRLAHYADIPNVMPLDYFLHVRHAVHGDIAMLPDTMAVYRRHAKGMWFDAVADPPKFWLAQGRNHAAAYDAMLDLFPSSPSREQIVGEHADRILRLIEKIPGPEGRAALQDTIAHHPRFAMLALQHRWASPRQRLGIMRRRLAADAPSLRGVIALSSAGLRRRVGKNPRRR